MARPIFGKMKTIVLPVPESGTTHSVKTYKDEFGIDLSDYITFEDSEIHISFPNNSLILLDCSRLGIGDVAYGVKPGLIPVTNSALSDHDPGMTNADTVIGVFNNEDGVVAGLKLSVDKDADLTIENIQITNG